MNNIEKISVAEFSRLLVKNESLYLGVLPYCDANDVILHEAVEKWLPRLPKLDTTGNEPRTATKKSYGLMFSNGSRLDFRDEHDELNCYRRGNFLAYEKINRMWDKYYYTVIFYKIIL